MSAKAKETMMEHFDESLKLEFCEEDDYEEDDDDEALPVYPCPVPGVPDNDAADISGGDLILSKADVKGIFDPIFSEITQMVRRQVLEAENNTKCSITVCNLTYILITMVSKPVRGSPWSCIQGVILVGGFGSSEYLRQHLVAQVVDRDGNPIKVLQAPDA